MNCPSPIHRSSIIHLILMLVMVVFMWLTVLSSMMSFSAEEQKPRSKRPVETSSTTESGLWRSRRVCAANCLYLVLRSNGVDVDYGDLQHRLVKEEFTSLYDLRDVARQYGVELVLCKLTPDELHHVPLPAILHLEPVEATGESGGHFIAVLALFGKKGEEGIVFMDGTTAEIKTCPWQQILKDWSGVAAYANKPSHPIRWSVLGFLGGILAGGTIAFVLPCWWSRRRLRSKVLTH